LSQRHCASAICWPVEISLGSYRYPVVHKEENTMKKLVLMVAALGLTVAFAAPVVAADKVPTTKAACEKAKMHWDDATKACTKGSM
jgi:hypothetical protein